MMTRRQIIDTIKKNHNFEYTVVEITTVRFSDNAYSVAGDNEVRVCNSIEDAVDEFFEYFVAESFWYVNEYYLKNLKVYSYGEMLDKWKNSTLEI